jgi:hypothetical protein
MWNGLGDRSLLAVLAPDSTAPWSFPQPGRLRDPVRPHPQMVIQNRFRGFLTWCPAAGKVLGSPPLGRPRLHGLHPPKDRLGCVGQPTNSRRPDTRTERNTFGNRMIVTDKCTISGPVHRAHATDFWNATKEAANIGSSSGVPLRRPGFQELNSHGPGVVKTGRSLSPQVQSWVWLRPILTRSEVSAGANHPPDRAWLRPHPSAGFSYGHLVP